MNEAASQSLISPAPADIRTDEEILADKILQESFVNPYERSPKPPIFMCLLSNNEEQPFAMLGGITAVTGKAKAKKTMLVSMIAAAALKNDVLQDKFKCDLPDDKNEIVVFDTEQLKPWTEFMMDRVFALTGGDSDEMSKRIRFHTFRKYNYLERILAIKRYLQMNPKTGLVIIDGIRDLLPDINDSKQSNEAAQLLMTLTDEHNVHIIAVIHQNKGDSNLRGHIGTEVVNKADVVIEVEKDKYDKAISHVRPLFCRFPEFDDFSFQLNAGSPAIPIILHDYSESDVEDKNSKSNIPSLHTQEEHYELTRLAFNGRNPLSRTELIKCLSEKWGNAGVKLGRVKSTEFMAYVIQLGIVRCSVVKDGKHEYYFRDNGMVSEDDPPF